MIFNFKGKIMPKKKGLGRDVNKSLEVMDTLVGNLREFAHMPLKEGLSSNKVADEDGKMAKMINEASEDAFALINKVKDLKAKITGISIGKNSRFARNVITRFLESSVEE
jgi:hypothetical protein